MGVAESMLNNPLAFAMLSFKYRGSLKPSSPQLGDVYDDLCLGVEYIYTGSEWLEFAKRADSSTDSSNAKMKLKKTICDCCGAKLPVSNYDRNGLVECRFCSTIHQAWEAY